MGFSLNQDQSFIVNKAIDWYYNSSEQIFQYSGNAGTGKSVVLNEIINRLQIDQADIAPMSYIGAAAIVMRLKGLHNAKTIHSWLYEPVEVFDRDANGKIIMDHYLNRPKKHSTFKPKPLPSNIKLIVIDEAAAVPMNIANEINSRKIKIIACGDLDQLPPVIGDSGYLVNGKIYILHKIMRQAEGSAIIQLAQRAKLGLPIHKGVYRNVLVISRDEVTDDMLKFIPGRMVICGRNATRELLTSRMRNSILHINSTLPGINEPVICRKNNWSIESNGIGLANGLIGTVMNSPDPSEFDGKTFMIDFLPYNIDSLFRELRLDYQYFIASFARKNLLKNDRYSVGEKFDFAYCITTHISQGSQYYDGMYFEEFLNRDINKNLNYTGITRFSNSMIYVKPEKKYW